MQLWLIEVSLYDIGEPLWCEDLINFIAYASKRNIGTSISTTLSLQKEDHYWKELVSSGLDYLIVAIDGVTEEVYRQYRINGDFPLVMKNLHTILRYKELCSSKLIIEWQMIEFDWNRHEIEQAKTMAKALGMDFNLISNIATTRAQAQSNKQFNRKANCLLPYLIFIANVYGEVNPCYKYYNQHMQLGNIYRESFEDIWNNSQIQEIRDTAQIKNRRVCCKCIE